MNTVKIQYFRQLNPKIIPKRRIEKKQNLIYDHPKIVTYTGPITKDP